MDDFADVFVPNIQSANKTNYQQWKQSNPGEAAKWEAYRDAAIAHKKGDPAIAVPTMATKYGKALVAAGKLHVSVTDIGSVYVPPPVGVADRYASPSGSDTNAGTIDLPYRTANKLFNSLLAGETGALREGIYADPVSGFPQRVIDVRGAGTASAGSPIRVINYPGEVVQLRGSVYIERNYLQMDGIRANSRPLDDRRDEVWWVHGNNHTYTNCDFTNNSYTTPTAHLSKGSAMFIDPTASGTTIDHCSFHDVNFDEAAGANQPHGVYCEGSNTTVRNTKFWNIANYSTRGVFGFQFWPSGNGGLIQNCIFDNVASGIAAGQVTNTIIENNIISNTRLYGLWVTTDGVNTLFRNNHSYAIGNTWIAYYPSFAAGVVVETGTTTGNPLYTSPSTGQFYPFTGAGTSGKGTDW